MSESSGQVGLRFSDIRQNELKNLVVEPNIALHIPAPFYMFVAKFSYIFAHACVILGDFCYH